MSLSDIGVRVEGGGEQPTGMADALLREVLDHLGALAERGVENAIDLSALPMNDADRHALAAGLGRGEVDITVRTAGESRIHETAFPGVWWVTHHDEAGGVLTERIEIGPVPEIVRSHPQDVRQARLRLQDLLNNPTGQENR